MKPSVPLFRASDDAAARAQLHAAARRVIDSGRYVLGAEVAAFERGFAAACGAGHCVGVANGSDALELALRAVGVRPGQRVIAAANAGGYASAAILALGALPVYADVDASLCLDPAAVAPLARDAAAIVVTHLYGTLARIEAIAAIAQQAGVPVVEDCAHAHGARLRDRHAGTFGAAGCFSFYPTKNLGALGDAGAVVTADAALADRLRALRQYGWRTKYQVAVGGGRNSRLDEMQAAFLRVRLPDLAHDNARRMAVLTRYRDAFASLPVRWPAVAEGHVAHLAVLRVRDRAALVQSLAAAGIDSAVHFPVPDHLQPTATRLAHAPLPVTEAACAEVLTLPCFPAMTEDEVERVIAAVAAHYACRGRAHAR